MLLTYWCVWVVVLLKYPFQGHFLFDVRRPDLMYFDVSKLIFDPFSVIDVVVMRAPPGFTVGGRLTNCLKRLDP